jgi:hypothetical protein
MSSGAQSAEIPGLDRDLPPIIEVGSLALVFCIVGVIYLSASGFGTPDLAPAIGLLVAACLVVLANTVMLSRIRPFNWHVFWVVGGWTLLAYAITAGMLMYTFIYDALPSGKLSLLVATLAVFAIDIPMMLAFSVARFQPVPSRV